MRTVKIHSEAICEDYEKLLKDPNSPAFIKFSEREDGSFFRVEIVDKDERKKLEESRLRSVQELKRVIEEQSKKEVAK